MTASKRSVVVTSFDARRAWPVEWDVVLTPLDLIRTLDRTDRNAIETVVLAGAFARDRDVAAFLRTHYPQLEIMLAVDAESWVARELEPAAGG